MSLLLMTDSFDCTIFHEHFLFLGLVVRYRPVDFDRDRGIPGVQMERQQVWDFTSKGEFGTIMDTLVPYQPEDDDYVVTSMEKGII